MTNLLQPADVVWSSVIKQVYGDKWNDWFIFDEKRLTVHGNMVSPGYTQVIKWMSDIWEEFDSSMIEESFRKSG